ncbi:MAG: DUF4349 domain-containing protein [Pyrinomonadaceae bacterium]
MRHFGTLLLLTSLLLSSSACERASAPATIDQQPRDGTVSESTNVVARPEAEQAHLASTAAPAAAAETSIAGRDKNDGDFAANPAQYKTQQISFDPTGQNAPVTVVPDRKVIRNAELTVETGSPAEAQRKLASVAEASGGFVVTSESKQDGRTPGARSAEIVTLEMRVPAAQFDAVINAVRGVGGRVIQEKISGKDVTEEYIDMEARLRAQRALEAQILEIMKRAQRVSDALEVNAQLALVRSEIERLEGRRRFLENQSSLSTIKITLQPAAPLVSAETTGFFSNLRRAFGDGVDFAAALVVGMVRVVVTLLPVALLLCLPAWVAWRVLRRKVRRAKTHGDWHPATPPAGA